MPYLENNVEAPPSLTCISLLQKTAIGTTDSLTATASFEKKDVSHLLVV